MIRMRKKTIALITALVFMLTIVAPMAAFAADRVTYDSSYDFISAGKDKTAGTATVTAVYGEEGDAVKAYFKLTLPEGVEFAEDVDSANFDDFVTGATNFYTSSDDSVTVWEEFSGADIEVKFDFTVKYAADKGWLDIDSDFTGNLDVTVEVIGVNDEDKMVWSESDTVTIAKVAAGEAVVKVGDAKNVSAGGNRTGAKITIEESVVAELADEEIYFDIATSGVEFNNATNVVKSPSNTTNNVDPKDNTRWIVTPGKSVTFPGTIEFVPVLDIAPNVTGDIKITVTSKEKTVDKTTVVVATIGDAKAEVDELEDNDTVAYVGQRTELDVELTITTDDAFKAGDIMTFELNEGTLVSVESGLENPVKKYSDDSAFYVTFHKDDDSEFTMKKFIVELPNDAEPGDLTLTIGGDYGDLGEVVIGEIARPFTVTAETPNILSEALNQAAGDIIITEVDDGAFSVNQEIYFELPSGIELKGTPEIDVTEGNLEASLKKVDDDVIVVKIDRASTDASTIEISKIKYDTGRLALFGPVELEVYIADPDVEDVDGVMYTFANAVVDDQSTVTATFTVGDEGVAIVNGRTLVQVNLLCDVLGLQKSWDAAAKTAYFAKDGKVVAFPMGENAIYINGVKLPIDQGGMIINDFTYATLRGLQLAFGGTLDWDNDTKTATFVFNK